MAYEKVSSYEDEEKAAKFALIFNQQMKDKGLTRTEAMLVQKIGTSQGFTVDSFGRLMLVGKKQGEFCPMSNKTFADILKVSIQYVREMLNKLTKEYTHDGKQYPAILEKVARGYKIKGEFVVTTKQEKEKGEEINYSKIDNDIKGRLELTPLQYQLLDLLHSYNRYSQYSITQTGEKVILLKKKQIAETLKCSTRNIGKVVKKLEEKGILGHFVQNKNQAYIYFKIDWNEKELYKNNLGKICFDEIQTEKSNAIQTPAKRTNEEDYQEWIEIQQQQQSRQLPF